MLNAEKFKKEIEELNYDFALGLGNKIVPCNCTPCHLCRFEKGCKQKKSKWLLSEYEPSKIEPEVYNLKVDDKIEVSDTGVGWRRRHFKCIKDGVVIAWNDGRTSFSALAYDDVTEWEYARIPREE